MLAASPSSGSYGFVLAAAFTGYLAVAYLLPTPRRQSVFVSLLMAVLALFTFAMLLFGGFGGDIPFTVEALLFWAFSLAAFLFSVLMITQRNPARSAVHFALVILNVCGLFLLQGAPFLTAATIIIYAGAIIVTFLFVIMLSRQDGPSDENDRSREPSLAAAVGFVLLATLLIGLQRVYDTSEIDAVIARAERYAAGEIDATFSDPNAAEKYFTDVEQVKVRLGFPKDDAPDHTEEVRFYVRQVDYAIKDLRLRVPPMEGDNPKETFDLNRQIHDGLAFLKAVRQGTIKPNVDVRLSPYGQARPVTAGATSQPQPGALPARNVAALGRALFTDHLIAVELGGTLLLVATIGAIAIAGGRRREAAE